MIKRCYFLSLFFLCVTYLNGQTLAIEGFHLDKAVPDGRVDTVWTGINMPQGFTGKDVIIGFTDWGFDYTHPVFYDTAMTNYRVLRAWDQFKNSGPAPEGFGFGTEFVGREALLNARCDTSNVYSYNYHGTHVASIAGGAGAGTAYRGVAFEADLLFVSIVVSEEAVMDAFRWMYKVAQEEQKRLVINMSWGLYYVGNMDGTGKMMELVDSLSNLGVVFVSSGGNNGDVNFHISHQFPEEDTLRTVVTYTSGSNKQWGESVSMTNTSNQPFSFAVQVMNASNEKLTVSPFYNTEEGDRYVDTFLVVNEIDTIVFNALIEKSNGYNNRPQVRLRIKSLPRTTYRVGLIVAAEEGEFHAWNVIELTNDVGNWGAAFASFGMTGWKNGDNKFGIGAPGSFDPVVTVAAHQAQYALANGSLYGGQIAGFSSFGPAIDHRTKPDISASGNSVRGAISSFTDSYSGSYARKITFNDREYGFAALSGTSMSSPFVAGVAALILQANPTLTSAQVKEILIETARQDQYTATSGEERFGYGKVDAYKAVKAALGITGMENIIVDKNRVTLFPNPTKDVAYISLLTDGNPVMLEVYDLYGKRLMTQSLMSGVNSIDLQNFPAGCYFFVIQDYTGIQTYKMIKN